MGEEILGDDKGEDKGDVEVKGETILTAKDEDNDGRATKTKTPTKAKTKAKRRKTTETPTINPRTAKPTRIRAVPRRRIKISRCLKVWSLTLLRLKLLLRS